MKDRFLNIDGFQIIQEEISREENKYYEGIFTQGNGYFHVRGSYEEGLLDAPQDESYTRTMKSVTTEIQRHPLSKQGTFLPLIMGKHPFLEEVIINLPFFMDIRILAGEEHLDMFCSNITNYKRTLNMQNGELVRSFIWHTNAGDEMECVISRFASMSDKRLFVQKISMRPRKGMPVIQIRSGIDGSVTTNGYCHFTECRPYADNHTMGFYVKTDAGESVLIKSYNVAEGMENENRTECLTDKVEEVFEGTLTGEIDFIKYSVLGCSRDVCDDYEQDMENSLQNAKTSGYETLLEGSEREWKTKWKDTDIRISGCDKLQNALRFSLYHLLRCSNSAEDRTQICAKGFAGEAYYGRYFWDSEMYLLPFYLYTDPRSAKSLVGYRYHTLKGAKENAERYHCRGARYPWQSGLTGTEQCSLWEYADNEIHITADVAFGILHYYRATGDELFMFEKGIEVLLETALFWVDRVDRDEKGEYHLLNVMGPDEYSPMTKDNGFTNYMVKYSLNATKEMLEYFKRKRPEQYLELLKKAGIEEEELEQFKKIAESLPVPYDEKRDLYLQSADFEEYARIDMEDLWKDKKRAFGHYISQEKIYRSRCIKQADTIALMSIFPDQFTDHQVKTAYEYYKPLTTHDSSLSPAVHALAANRLGYDQETEAFLDRTLAVDMELVRKGAEDGIHIANCGALWQMVIQGFLGVKPAYQNEELEVNPQIPDFIKEIEAVLVWKGKKYRVIADKSKVSVERMCIKPKALLFDLDGVLTDTAEYHYQAWKRLSDELGLTFDRNINERLKGVSRQRSFEIILEANNAQERFTSDEIKECCTRKNEYYKTLITQVNADDILPEIKNFLVEAKKKKLKLAVASASRNAQTVLQGLGLSEMFDYIADASKIRYTKPDPEVFSDCMEQLKMNPWECIAFEDAAAGIEAIKRAHITSVGIGENVLSASADIVLKSTADLRDIEVKKALNIETD